jgi:hypothetical protein
LLSVGLNTPSLRLRESNATPHSTKFNIDRDIPQIQRRKSQKRYSDQEPESIIDI